MVVTRFTSQPQMFKCISTTIGNNLSIYFCVYLSIYLSIYLYIYLSKFLSICQILNLLLWNSTTIRVMNLWAIYLYTVYGYLVTICISISTLNYVRVHIYLFHLIPLAISLILPNVHT